MPRIISAIAATVTTLSLIAVAHAAGSDSVQRIISTDAHGQPIVLKRMVVTATALPPA